MKTIETTDEMYDFLIDLSKELNTQDHRCTAMPYFFQIRTQKEVAVPEGNGTEAWHYDGSTIETEKEITETIYDWHGGKISKAKIKKMDEWEREGLLEKIGYQKCYYDVVDEFENAFLTEKACKEHIRRNAYNYNKPVDYLSHASRNPELEQVLQFLCELTGGEVHK